MSKIERKKFTIQIHNVIGRIFSGPRATQQKTLRFGLQESKAQDKNKIISNRIDVCVCVLIIDCY